jgi:hypothetical protein
VSEVDGVIDSFVGVVVMDATPVCFGATPSKGVVVSTSRKTYIPTVQASVVVIVIVSAALAA